MRKTFREEALTHFQSEELHIPQHTGQRTEDEIVTPYLSFGIVTDRLISYILLQAVSGICHESA